MIYSNWYSNSIPTPSMVQWTIAGWVVNWRVQWFPGDADQFSPALRLYYSNSTRRRRSLDTLPLTQWGWTLAWDIYHQLIKTSPPLSQPCVGSREVYLCFEKYQKNISTNQIKQGSDPPPQQPGLDGKEVWGKIIFICQCFTTAIWIKNFVIYLIVSKNFLNLFFYLSWVVECWIFWYHPDCDGCVGAISNRVLLIKQNSPKLNHQYSNYKKSLMTEGEH